MNVKMFSPILSQDVLTVMCLVDTHSVLIILLYVFGI
jgi:hypothetical protein